MNCKYCKADCVRRGEHREKECKGYMPMTNADRIRAMTDEEMSEFLCSITECGICEWCGLDGCGLLKWLQQPAGGAEDG